MEQSYLCHCNSHWSAPFHSSESKFKLIPQTTSSGNFREDPVAVGVPVSQELVEELSLTFPISQGQSYLPRVRGRSWHLGAEVQVRRGLFVMCSILPQIHFLMGKLFLAKNWGYLDILIYSGMARE